MLFHQQSLWGLMRKKIIKDKLKISQLDEPIRSDIYSAERLEEYAEYLSSELVLDFKKKKGHSLLPRLKENAKELVKHYQKMTSIVSEGGELSPAAEWIVDNFHIIEDQIREIREDLPARYYRELPKIEIGELKGHPRVYAIALTLVAHLDSSLDIKIIERFINAYQQESTLLIGEVWALPIALRIALVENLRRISEQVVISHEIKIRVDELEKELLSSKNSPPQVIEKITKNLSELLGKSEICDCAVISHFSQKLHARTKEIVPACDCIDEYLESKYLDMEDIVRVEHQLQAASQVTVSNIISSMRLLSNTDWQIFFESVSKVEKVLREDPAGAYDKMTFSSRDEYLHSIERLHKKTGYDEVEIAKEAIQMAHHYHSKDLSDIRKNHVGYYLIRSGVSELEKKVGYRPGIVEKLRRQVLNRPFPFYMTSLILLCFGLLLPLMYYLYEIESYPYWYFLVSLIVLVPASDSAINILNLATSWFVGPFILPKLELEDGIPDNAKTFVVVPTIIGEISEVFKLLEDLEIRYLANPERNLFFALLSDFTDSDFESNSTDKTIIDFLNEGIRRLNQKYADGDKRFYLFHRKRLWNSSENKWMGWERKRGKIQEFNLFLRGSDETSFIEHPEYNDFFSEIKYVITLDSDTKLPRLSARKLVGTILHPLNQPQVNKLSGLVDKGYGILQPRISITPESSMKSHFARIFSGHTGIDPYTKAVSDSYQDLFGEGIFTGKGLYAVDAFESSLNNRIPENTLLSHDLFEGVFARTALVSDIELLDDYPSSFESFAKRDHRWIRGDWQIFKWIFDLVPDSNQEHIENSLSPISRWKIFDNLRRSLVAPMTTISFLACWSVIPGNPLFWSLIFLSVLALPLYAHTASQLLRHPRDLPILVKLRGVYEDFKMYMSQLFISITALPYLSYLHVDAIVRTIYRTYISKTKLLEWKTAAQVEEQAKRNQQYSTRMFIVSSFVVFFSFFLIWMLNPTAYLSALPILVIWFASPVILQKLSQTREKTEFRLEKEDERLLRSISCRTWNFFETFVDEESHWLPPDNFQEDPSEIIAHRTSPTNMGLYLLSCCSAFDFGYLGPQELIRRLDQTLTSMENLTKHFGHFYNWYDTLTLNPLMPEYISTVDSGNLGGHLLAVKQVCLDLKEKPFQYSKIFQGIEDIFIIMLEECHKLDAIVSSNFSIPFADVKNQVRNTLHYLESLHMPPVNQSSKVMEQVRLRLEVISQKMKFLSSKHDQESFKSILLWTEKATARLIKSKKELENLKNNQDLKNLKESFEHIASRSHQLVINMDFSKLYDEKKKLFSIGFNVRESRCDESYYDLLASEARLASFLGIAKGDVPEEHWFHLGRQMTSLFQHRILISWSASMFEYLMPLLVMKDYSGTLLYESHRSSVLQQINYSRINDYPWGLSESGYNSRDVHMNYQYGPFGVPGAGLKRGLSQDYVISPYSTALAANVFPEEAIKNFRKLLRDDLLTDYGFYEAVDFTENRLPSSEKFVIVKNFMAHHQGMTLVSMDNVLHNNMMQEKFHRDPMIKSSELLLQERIPKRISYLYPRAEELDKKQKDKYRSIQTLVEINAVNSDFPETRVLSNGRYSTMLTASGGGYSKNGDLSVLRWGPDTCLDRDGQFFFIRDCEDNILNSITFSPLWKNPEKYKTMFSAHKVEYWFENKNYSVHKEVVVSAEDNVELRRITISNLTDKNREFELVSYSEPVLSTADADISHPAFNKMFIETEYVPEKTALLFKRRRSNETVPDLYGIHQVRFDKKSCDNFQFDTDRMRFFGRNNNWEKAKGLELNATLSNKTGAVLDTVLVFKVRIKLSGFESTKILFSTGVADSRGDALTLLDQYHDVRFFEREDEMAWTHSQIELKHINLEPDEINTFQKIAGALLVSNSNVMVSKVEMEKNHKNQSYLWKYGISGDLPILMVSIEDKYEMKIIQDLLQLHEYLRNRYVKFDLVIICDESSSYRMTIHDELLHQVRLAGGQTFLNKKGGIFLLRQELISESDFILLRAVAKIYLDGHQGSLKNQINQLLKTKVYEPPGEIEKLYSPAHSGKKKSSIGLSLSSSMDMGDSGRVITNI